MRTKDDIWLSTDTPPRRDGQPGLFLDRDGVLVREVNYLKNKEDVALEPGAATLIRWAARRGFGLAAVTNQSGIARGRISWAEFEAVEAEIARLSSRPAPEPQKIEVAVIPPELADTLSELAARAEALADAVEEKAG